MVALLLFMGITGVVSFLKLGRTMESAYNENYISVHAAYTMNSSLEREDSYCLLKLSGSEKIVGSDFSPIREQELDPFIDALKKAKENITLAGESELLSKISELYQQYIRLLTAIPDDKENAWDLYHHEIYPLFKELKITLVELVRINQENMIEYDRQARLFASYSTAWMAVITTMGLFIILAIGRIFIKTVMKPLNTIVKTTVDISNGHLERRVAHTGSDEVGQLAQAINFLAENLEKIMETERTKLTQARQFALALINRESRPIVIISEAGFPVLYNQSAEVLLNQFGAQEFRQKIHDALNAGEDDVPILFTEKEGIRYKLSSEILRSTAKRQLGKLILFNHFASP